jgi:hypothetical protein
VIEQAVKTWRGAVVTLQPKDGRGAIIRPAAFLFDRPGGFAWLEPGYADPWGSPSPTWHEVEASITRVASTIIYFDGPEYSGDIEEYFGQTDAAGPLEWFAGWLKEQGRTWEEERARVIADGIIPEM